jgi:hypothetical protein
MAQERVLYLNLFHGAGWEVVDGDGKPADLLAVFDNWEQAEVIAEPSRVLSQKGVTITMKLPFVEGTQLCKH